MSKRNPTFARKVMSRDKKCQACGSAIQLQAHHIIPVSIGGTDSIDNGIALCAECHADRHPDMPRNLFLIKSKGHLTDASEKLFQFNVRVLPDTVVKVARLTAQRGVSQGAIVAEAIRLLDNAQNIGRHRACAQLGLTDCDHRNFVHWCIKNDVPPTATLDEWEGFLEEFDTGGDAADLDATQKGAMEVLT